MKSKQKNNNCGNRLKEFAIERYGSISELARKLGKNPSYLLAYTSGRRYPHYSLLIDLGNLGADLNYLLLGTRDEQLSSVQNILRKNGISNIRELEKVLLKYQKVRNLIELP